MANKNIERFVEVYGPVAQQVSKEINVDPNVLLGQWGLESRWGQSEMAKKHYNVGGIKDFSGHGHEAKDNKTGSTDKYVKFEDPEVFGMYYADQIKRNFPNAVNTGPDAGAFTRGLANGKYGSYYGVPQSEYLKSLTGAQAAIPQDKQVPFEPTEVKPPEAATGEGDMVTAPAPPPPPPTVDTSGASPGERFLGGALGTGAGVVSSGLSGVSAARTSQAVDRASKVAAADEAARIRQRAAAAAPTAAPVAPGAPGAPPQSVVRVQQPGGPLQLGTPGTYPTATGPGSGTFNYARKAGLTEIEAGKALDMTKQAGGTHDLVTQRREALNRIAQMGGGFVENPVYGGLMTPDQGAGGGPRASYTSTPGGLQQLPKAAPIPTTPPPPSMGARVMSGLDSVSDMFKGMMRPVASAAGKYVLPPLAGLSAGLDVAELAHEYDKPADQRDYTKMALKGASAIGGGLSMIPTPWTQGLGIPLSLGSSAIQAYREDPEYFNKKLKEYTGYSP